MKDEISLKSILDIIKSRILIILAATAVVMTAAALVTRFYITPQYTSTIKLCIVGDIQSEADNTVSGQRNTLLYVKDLIDTCIVTLNTGDAYHDIINRLNESYGTTVSVDSSDISVAQIGSSSVLRVDVTTSNPQLSYDTCYAFESMARDRIPSVGEIKVEKVDSPVVAKEPSSPSFVKNCVIGALLGLIISSAVVIFIAMLDNTVKDGTETAEHFDMLLLAEIPDLYSARNKERYYEYKQNSGHSKERSRRGR